MYRPLVEIKKPCYEALEKRKPGEAGSYCKSCQTLVIDFTWMTPEEISQYLLIRKNEVHCGTFHRRHVSKGNKTDRLLIYMHQRKCIFFSLLVLVITILASCRTRMKGTPAYTNGPIRPLDQHTQTIDHLK